jgi:hypothetical protein
MVVADPELAVRLGWGYRLRGLASNHPNEHGLERAQGLGGACACTENALSRALIEIVIDAEYDMQSMCNSHLQDKTRRTHW